MGKVEVRPFSLAEYDAFWMRFESEGSAIVRNTCIRMAQKNQLNRDKEEMA